METTPTPDQRQRLPELFEYRAAAAKRRAGAFSDAPEYVLGTEVLPLTPATFSILFTVGSPFVCGGRPTELDVRHYLWFHSPLYSHTGKPGWRERKKQALAKLEWELGGWRWRFGLKPEQHRYVAGLALAVSEITQIVENTFADSPTPSGTPGKPLATLEASFVHEFAMAYKWKPDETRHTPLKKLIQLHRCIRAGRGEEVRDDGEDRIQAEYLSKKNEAAAARRKAKHG